MSIFKQFATVLVLLFVTACAAGDLDLPPEIGLADLRPVEAGLFEQRVAVTLRIRNPNDGPLSIDGYRFAIELNGRPFASGFSDRTLRLARLSEATTEATAVVSTLDLMRQLVAAPMRGGFEYRLTGTAFVGDAAGRTPMTFEQSGKLDLLDPQ